jgi:hypothetical protein
LPGGGNVRTIRLAAADHSHEFLIVRFRRGLVAKLLSSLGGAEDTAAIG